MADVFLSYARLNAPQAERSAAELRLEGFSVWFDEKLPAHRAYSDVIEEELEAAKAVLVLWSSESVRSQWVRSEANRARETGRLVQVRFDDARLPMPFDQIQCADLRGWKGDPDAPGWRSVVESIAALAGEKEPSAQRPPPTRGAQRFLTNRRSALIGGGAVAAGAVAGVMLWRGIGQSEQLSPEAQLLLEKGYAALQNNDALDPQDPGSTAQAIALLNEATQVAPRSPAAWGGLALANAVRKRVVSPSERAGLDARTRAAAEKALELDPKEGRALAALRLLEPVYRNWLAAEAGDRAALRRNPNIPILMFILSDMLGNVGRWGEAAELSRNFDRTKFLIPGADRKVIMNLWAAGDLQGADGALDSAVQRWPQHPQIWRIRMAYLMYSGRPSEALALFRGGAERPVELSSEFLDAVRVTAEALAGQRDAADAISHDLKYLDRDPRAALPVAQACAALGNPDEAFALLDGYYFGEREWARLAPPGGDQDRITYPLFQPPMRELWGDARFGRLLDRIGLENYWRRSGTIPDFRKAG
jgi:tetratricopeptide (TPR) repeat protein